MQKINKKIVIIIAVILVLIGILVGITLASKNKKANYDYYYTYEYDDNLITQTVKVYNKDDELQSNYYIFYKDEVITLTTADKAVLTITNLDLKDKPVLTLVFADDSHKYKVGPKE